MNRGCRVVEVIDALDEDAVELLVGREAKTGIKSGCTMSRKGRRGGRLGDGVV